MRETKGGFLIGKIKQIQARVFERMLMEYGIDQFNGAQGRILFVLWRNDNIPITKLSEETGLAKTTLTSMLDRLEQQGCLLRSYDPADRRRINIVLTQQARAMEQTYQQVSEEMNRLFYDGFTPEEIAIFEDCLERILLNLKKEEEKK